MTPNTPPEMPPEAPVTPVEAVADSAANCVQDTPQTPPVAPVVAARPHYDPLDPEHGWARNRKLGESRFAKIVLMFGFCLALYATWMVYTANDLDPQRTEHISALTKIWLQLKDLVNQWLQGTNIPTPNN